MRAAALREAGVDRSPRRAVFAAGDPAQSHPWLNCETSNVRWSIAFNG
ncbi:hypothetical protein I546_3729 [Mycobacterium kansasii 732]|nr:hypothetical protein I546_3729 [Mycobacterium kansasii 732]